MVGRELRHEEVRSLKDLVEEVAQLAPRKSKKKKIWRDEAGPSKTKAHERTSSHVKQRKGVDKVNVGSLIKIPMAPQKHKGKEKFLNQWWN
jgi:hypothetical protein